MSNVIFFLDIDGTVNNPRVAIATPPKHRANLYGWIDPISVNLINEWTRIIEEHGDEVLLVLSSTWRGGHDNYTSATMMLAAQGFHTRLHEDFKTRRTGMTIDGVRDIRGFQIRDWLNDHPEETKYIIIDDDSDFTDEQKEFHIHTSGEDGILCKHHYRALDIIEDFYKEDDNG